MNPEESSSSPALPGTPPRAFPMKAARARVYGAYVCGYLLTILGILFLIGFPALFFFLGGMRSPLADLQLDRDHLTAEAVVDSMSFMAHTHINSQNPWKTQYHWTTQDGDQMKGTGFILSGNKGSIEAGSIIPIEYLPGRPEISRPAAGSAALMPLWVYLLIIAISLPELIAGIICAIYARRQIDATANILRTGEAVHATVLDKRVNRFVRVNNRNPVDIHYQFQTRRGDSFTGQDRSYDIGWAYSLKAGDRVAVVYDPLYPDNNILWPPEAE